MAKNYEIKYNGNNFNIPENLLNISDTEEFEINSSFSKLDIVKIDEIMGLAYLPLKLKIYGSFEKDYLNIELLVENFTNEKWFIPSPLMYHGNRFLTLSDDSGVYNYPSVEYKHRVITNDETFFLVEEKDVIKINYKLNLTERLCTHVTKISVNHSFSPKMLTTDKDIGETKFIRAALKSENYLNIDCKNKLIESFINK